MARLTYAAKALTKQLEERYKDPKVTPDGDVDGLGVHRTIRVGNKNAVKWLGKVAEAWIEDPRIEEVREEKGELLVTFVSGRRADDRTPFPFDDAELVADEGGE